MVETVCIYLLPSGGLADIVRFLELSYVRIKEKVS